MSRVGINKEREDRVDEKIFTINPVLRECQRTSGEYVVYKVPCSLGKSYVGEPVRRLETRIHQLIVGE